MINQVYLKNSARESILLTINQDTYQIEPSTCPWLFLEKGEYSVKLEAKHLAFPAESTLKIDDSGVIECSINEHREMVLSTRYSAS